MTAQLSWYVQNFVVILCSRKELQQNGFLSNLNNDGKIIGEMGYTGMPLFNEVKVDWNYLNPECSSIHSVSLLETKFTTWWSWKKAISLIFRNKEYYVPVRNV